MALIEPSKESNTIHELSELKINLVDTEETFETMKTQNIIDPYQLYFIQQEDSSYWANITISNSALYNTAPEVGSLKIGNGTTSTSTKSVSLIYNSDLEALNFVFV